MMRLADGLRVDRPSQRVEIDAAVCLRIGFLEQVACSPGTREHEAILVVVPRPSDVHAALLLLGLEPGHPGRWSVVDDRLMLEAPVGPRVSIAVRWTDDAGQHECPVEDWLRPVGEMPSPRPSHWIFAGSGFVHDPTAPTRERYAADLSGSVIGIVTFGDETLACPEVMSDQEAIEPLEWEAFTERIPPEGTPVTIVITPAD
ncbi:MAG: hypothetical protein KDA22_10380 [Phycisphaerales bacterium]|nr:hypothetical protein [Phycisphaerales bacterium]